MGAHSGKEGGVNSQRGSRTNSARQADSARESHTYVEKNQMDRIVKIMEEVKKTWQGILCE